MNMTMKIRRRTNKEIQIQIEILFQKIFKIQMEIHPKKVFENAFQIQILSKYTSLATVAGMRGGQGTWRGEEAVVLGVGVCG